MVETDVTDAASLGRALDGAFAVLASLPYRFNLHAMQGALAAGAHYLDLGGLFHVTRRQLALAPEFEGAGLMAVLGMDCAFLPLAGSTPESLATCTDRRAAWRTLTRHAV